MFSLPAAMMEKLPPAAKDGNYYLDVRVGGRWDGIIVVDANGNYLGVYIRRRIEEWVLPFSLTAIEDLRRASILNRALAAFPFELWDTAVLSIVILSPILLSLAVVIFPIFAACTIALCAMSIHVLYLAQGFLLVRLPVAVCGICQIMFGVVLLIRFVVERWV